MGSSGRRDPAVLQLSSRQNAAMNRAFVVGWSQLGGRLLTHGEGQFDWPHI